MKEILKYYLKYCTFSIKYYISAIVRSVTGSETNIRVEDMKLKLSCLIVLILLLQRGITKLIEVSKVKAESDRYTCIEMTKNHFPVHIISQP